MNLKSAMGYAVGDFGINLYFISVMTYLLYFYTDVLGISAAAAAGVFFVARLIDAISDPIMGAIAERTRSRWGRMRPYMLFGAIPLALISIATFTVPDFDTPGKVIWAYVTYTLAMLVYTFATVGLFAGVVAVLATVAVERLGGRLGGVLASIPTTIVPLFL